MGMKIYGRTKPQPNGKKSEIRLCNVNRKYSMFSFNACALRELGMEKGMRMLFAQDNDTNAWFFAFGDTDNMEDGSRLQTQVKKGKVVGVRVQNKVVIDMICEDAKVSRATFNISMHPKREGGREWYRILTTTPYRVDEY